MSSGLYLTAAPSFKNLGDCRSSRRLRIEATDNPVMRATSCSLRIDSREVLTRDVLAFVIFFKPCCFGFSRMVLAQPRFRWPDAEMMVFTTRGGARGVAFDARSLGGLERPFATLHNPSIYLRQSEREF
jgi:hypothetical protein